MSFPIDIAITFDDLPSHENIPAGFTRLEVANQILAALKKHHIEGVYGFINEQTIGESQDNYDVLEAWVNQGQLLGNHTSSHIDVNRVGIRTFIADIEANEPILKKLMGIKNYKYFRYPYLSEGETKVKRDAARQYLFDNVYQIAEVTTDFLDYEWNDPYNRCLALDDQESIQWLKKTYIEQSFLNQFIISMGEENPTRVQELYNSVPEAQLERLCRQKGELIVAPERILRVL